jgi:predicted Fe-S protein YdhL (DUF1289 family)
MEVKLMLLGRLFACGGCQRMADECGRISAMDRRDNGGFVWKKLLKRRMFLDGGFGLEMISSSQSGTTRSLD